MKMKVHKAEDRAMIELRSAIQYSILNDPTKKKFLLLSTQRNNMQVSIFLELAIQLQQLLTQDQKQLNGEIISSFPSGASKHQQLVHNLQKAITELSLGELAAAKEITVDTLLELKKSKSPSLFTPATGWEVLNKICKTMTSYANTVVQKI